MTKYDYKFHDDFVTDELDYQLFYLTPGGDDVNYCGKTAETACKSLEQILSIYYNKSSIPQRGLEIITSNPLININKQLMVRWIA